MEGFEPKQEKKAAVFASLGQHKVLVSCSRDACGSDVLVCAWGMFDSGLIPRISRCSLLGLGLWQGRRAGELGNM